MIWKLPEYHMRLVDAIQHTVDTGNDSATLGVSGIADLKRIEVGKFAKFLVPMDQPLPSDLRAHYGHACPGHEPQQPERENPENTPMEAAE
jgi:hypothetical protein